MNKILVDFYDDKGEEIDSFFMNLDEVVDYDIMPDFKKLRIRVFREILIEELK